MLRAPLRIMLVQAVLWGFATALFAGINATYSALLALGVGMTVALGGLTTSAAAYLVAELALRPVASRALMAGPVTRRGVPGVATRWLLAWALGTGAPLIGLVAVGIVALTDVPIDETPLAITLVVLGGIALVFGAFLSTLAAYATVHPIASIRRGLDRVGEGDFAADVAVWDSTEMGLLQSGFNEMAAGLRERERIRDLFGRQVGHEAARQALGAESRFEYTVIGDPVNEAARPTELAKERPSRVLASGPTIAAAGDEGARWALRETVTLRGRAEPTPLAEPAG